MAAQKLSVLKNLAAFRSSMPHPLLKHGQMSFVNGKISSGVLGMCTSAFGGVVSSRHPTYIARHHFSSSSFSGGVEVGKLPLEKRLFIGGKFVEATSGSFWENINPATEEVICKVQEASNADIDMATNEAAQAFEKWGHSDGKFRARCLYKLADLMELHKDQLAYYESLDNGKPQHIAKIVDMKLAIDTIRYYAGWADKLMGKTIPIESIGGGETDIYKNKKFFCFTRHEPIGVVAQIIPWNFPILMAAWKLGPALAAGCTVVLKTSEKTPLSVLSLAHLINDAGFPAGVVNILNGFGPTVGHALVTHPRVNKVAFTGSTLSGTKALVAAAESGLKNTTLELGGKSPLIVFDDADVDKAVQTAHTGLFFNMGQCCIASSRVFVQEKVYDEFVQKCVEKAKASVMCSPLDEKCTQGPQIDKVQYEKILRYIQCGIDEGATCMTGGKAKPGSGYWIEPTVFVNVKDDMKIAQEEIFGPVMCIMKFKTVDEVIERGNCTAYGLGAGVCTRDMSKAFHVMSKLKAGTVYLNCYNVFDCAAPFGGFKQSGIGRELGDYGLNQYLEVKTVIADVAYNP